jgi:hypothetical protein
VRGMDLGISWRVVFSILPCDRIWRCYKLKKFKRIESKRQPNGKIYKYLHPLFSVASLAAHKELVINPSTHRIL